MELNIAAGYYYSELVDLANILRVIKIYNNPNSQLLTLDNLNPDAD
jgi:hypothetical protein